MIMDVLHFPNPFLRKQALACDFKNTNKDEIKKIISDMQESLYHYSGVGLAAPQVGISKRLFIIDIDQKIEKNDEGEIVSHQAGILRVYINPEIISCDGVVKSEEGCLSVPGIYEDVKRSKTLEVSYYDADLKKHQHKVEGFLAIVIQHEYDHLEGKLFIDRLATVKKTIIKNKFLKGKTL